MQQHQVLAASFSMLCLSVWVGVVLGFIIILMNRNLMTGSSFRW